MSPELRQNHAISRRSLLPAKEKFFELLPPLAAYTHSSCVGSL